MANYILQNTAAEIDTAIGNASNPDAAPTPNSQNMVFSGGVYSHVNTELGPFKGKTLTTAATGIAATDNDTSVPTCAAVNAALSSAVSSATFSINDNETWTAYNTASLGGFTKVTDSNSISSVSSGVITLGAGVYLLSFTGDLAFQGNGAVNISLVASGSFNNTHSSGSTISPISLSGYAHSSYKPYAGTATVAYEGATTLQAIGNVYYYNKKIKLKNLILSVVKLL